MPDGIQAGDNCIVRFNMTTGEGLAFEAGEPVVVERLEVDRARPGYHLVVFSERLGHEMTLSSRELARAGEPVNVARVPPSGPRREREEPPQLDDSDEAARGVGGPPPPPPASVRRRVPRPSGVDRRPTVRRTTGAVVLTAWVAVLLAGFFFMVAIMTRTNPHMGTYDAAADERYCEANLRIIEDAIEMYDAEYGSYPPSGKVADLLVPVFLKSSPTCPTSSMEYEITSQYPAGAPQPPEPRVECPTGMPTHKL